MARIYLSIMTLMCESQRTRKAVGVPSLRPMASLCIVWTIASVSVRVCTIGFLVLCGYLV